jgi:hypothetical protein
MSRIRVDSKRPVLPSERMRRLLRNPSWGEPRARSHYAPPFPRCPEIDQPLDGIVSIYKGGIPAGEPSLIRVLSVVEITGRPHRHAARGAVLQYLDLRLHLFRMKEVVDVEVLNVLSLRGVEGPISPRRGPAFFCAMT